MTANQLIELLQKVSNKDRELDFSINVEHGKEVELSIIDQFSVLVKWHKLRNRVWEIKKKCQMTLLSRG